MITYIRTEKGDLLATLPILYDPPSQAMEIMTFPNGPDSRTLTKLWIKRISDVVVQKNPEVIGFAVQRTILVKE